MNADVGGARRLSSRDLSSGLPADEEAVLAQPPDEPFWSENLLFALYDPANDVGFWLHLGTEPTEWSLWEDRALVFLPGDGGVLSMWAYHRTPPEQRPAGSNLAFRCIEPFRRWHVAFDGFGLHTSNEDMAAGRAREGRRQRFTLDLDVECVTPVWDAHTAAASVTGRGAMHEQGWAKEHYEQLHRATGTVRLPSGEVRFDGTGWRDHSRGPRGGGTGARWGGHVIIGCLFPESGRGWGLSRYWAPDGAITLEGGYVVDDGVLEHMAVVDAPRLRGLQLHGEHLHASLRSENRTLDLMTVRSLWLTMTHGIPVGADLTGHGLIYALNFGRCHWDGEVAYAYVERSDMLNRPAPALRAST